MQKDELGKFELRKVDRDSTGQERYIKTEEDDAIFRNKVQQMGQEAAAVLKDSTYEHRCAWILEKKEEGNALYKEKKFDLAIDKYLFSLCGFGFDKKQLSKE